MCVHVEGSMLVLLEDTSEMLCVCDSLVNQHDDVSHSEHRHRGNNIYIWLHEAAVHVFSQQMAVVSYSKRVLTDTEM